MNRHEKRTDQSRKSGLRSSIFLGMAGVMLVLLVLVIWGTSNSAPSGFWSKVIIVVAVALLFLRQVQRRLQPKKGAQKSRAAEPDPQSRLHLDDD